MSDNQLLTKVPLGSPDINGLDYMRQMLPGQDAEFDKKGIGALLGYRLTEAEDGMVVFSGAPTAMAVNPMGTVHGGWYGTLLDSCMACAICTRLPPGHAYTTLEYKINILRSVPIGREVRAIGTAQHVGRSTGIAIGEIRGVEDGKLYATGSTTCIVLKMPGAA
ncbi:PaaI family thioesterase [Pseudooceanicola aestuarii]|uniref:PaaI family thioesterase n=1 Tax=Pseudooceanicola aestuarii TaxID=2697319 RepID=UPI0013D33553|nr:PaaI family thioesterase [Pseudooceanicola aestuarii]